MTISVSLFQLSADFIAVRVPEGHPEETACGNGI
jgi:hypothetical protein